MISLMFVLLAGSITVPPAQAVQATLQSCVEESGRWICRYSVPDAEIVTIPGADAVAPARPSTAIASNAIPATAIPATEWVIAPAAATPPSVVSRDAAISFYTPTHPVDAPVMVPDAAILNDREAALLARCGDAGWLSRCSSGERREARALRDRQTAYDAVNREVTGLLAQDRCDAAVKAALDGGYLALARDARAFCALPAG